MGSDRVPRLRVVYICTSNVCRSPVAASLAHAWVAAHVADPGDVEVVSAGLTDRYTPWATPAEPRMVRAAAGSEGRGGGGVLEHLGAHASRALARGDVQGGAGGSDGESALPVVHVVMSAEQVGWVRDYCREHGFPQQPGERTVAVDPGGVDVPDPWFGDAAGYVAVFDHLRRAVPQSLAALARHHRIPLAPNNPDS